MGYESLSTIVVLVIIAIIMAVWLPRRTVSGMKQVIKHRSDRYSSSLHLVDEDSGTRFSDVRTPRAKGAIMPTTQKDRDRNREYIAQVRGLRRAAAQRRRWVATGLLAIAVVVLVLSFVLDFSPLYALIPAALLVVVCALGARASRQARAWEARIAAKERERRLKERRRAEGAARRERGPAAQETVVEVRAETVEEEPRTDVLEQREIRRALHQGQLEKQAALARREEQAREAREHEEAEAAQRRDAERRAEAEHREHAQLVVREEAVAYPPDETNELAEVSPSSAVDAFDMAVNQDLISFSLGSPRNGVEPPADEAQSLEIKSTKQVAKAEPRPNPEPAADEREPQAPAAPQEPRDEAAVQPKRDERPRQDRAPVNDTAAFHATEAAATVEAPDETSDSLGSSLESILARRGN